MSSAPVTPASETVEQRVERLLCRWRAETAALSSSTKITAHPAYQEIISLGVAALPFLFKDLERSHDGHLSKALASLTGNQPIPREQRGQIQKIAATWLTWAREHGYRW